MRNFPIPRNYSSLKLQKLLFCKPKQKPETVAELFSWREANNGSCRENESYFQTWNTHSGEVIAGMK